MSILLSCLAITKTKFSNTSSITDPTIKNLARQNIHVGYSLFSFNSFHPNSGQKPAYFSLHAKLFSIKPLSVFSTRTLVTNFICLWFIMTIGAFIVMYKKFQLRIHTNRTIDCQHMELIRQERKLRSLIKERDWLLKEIHHRVKNNLQIVISLLNTQSAYLKSEEARLAIKDSQHRMHAMALIHQKMYQSERLSCIDMQYYIKELVAYLKESFEGTNTINFKIRLKPISFDLSQAVLIGLILNEAISNAIKHAFGSERQTSAITISLSTTDQYHYQLKVDDNGKGLPIDFDLNKQNSQGINLIKGLSRQLDGKLTFKNKQGCQMEVEFIRKEMFEEELPVIKT